MKIIIFLYLNAKNLIFFSASPATFTLSFHLWYMVMTTELNFFFILKVISIFLCMSIYSLVVDCLIKKSSKMCLGHIDPTRSPV